MKNYSTLYLNNFSSICSDTEFKWGNKTQGLVEARIFNPIFACSSTKNKRRYFENKPKQPKTNQNKPKQNKTTQNKTTQNKAANKTTVNEPN